MATGALVREWPLGFSVWNEDTTAPDGSGYRLLQTYKNDPTREMMNDLYDVRTSICIIFISLAGFSPYTELSNVELLYTPYPSG